MRPQDQKLILDATAASVAAVAVAAALGPKACSRKGGAFSSALVEQCRGLRYDVPYEVDATPSTAASTGTGDRGAHRRAGATDNGANAGRQHILRVVLLLI